MGPVVPAPSRRIKAASHVMPNRARGEAENGATSWLTEVEKYQDRFKYYELADSVDGSSKIQRALRTLGGCSDFGCSAAGHPLSTEDAPSLTRPLLIGQSPLPSETKAEPKAEPNAQLVKIAVVLYNSATQPLEIARADSIFAPFLFVSLPHSITKQSGC
jgi:hypothetical protein